MRPGRYGVVRGLAARNDKTDLGWGVRVGSEMYPDYVGKDRQTIQGYIGGVLMSPDEAEEYASHLMACSVWARAQNRLDQPS